MAERPRLHSAVTGTAATAAPLVSPMLRIREPLGSRIVHLETPLPGPALDRFLAALGAQSVPPPGQVAAADGVVLVPIGPSVFLYLGPTSATEAFAVEVDVSGAWTHFVLAGPGATRLLAKGCALDLHPSHFPPGSAAAAGFARLRTIIWRADNEQFHMLVGRSYARTLWDWLTEAAAEFDGVLAGSTV